MNFEKNKNKKKKSIIDYPVIVESLMILSVLAVIHTLYYYCL